MATIVTDLRRKSKFLLVFFSKTTKCAMYVKELVNRLFLKEKDDAGPQTSSAAAEQPPGG